MRSFLSVSFIISCMVVTYSNSASAISQTLSGSPHVELPVFRMTNPDAATALGLSVGGGGSGGFKLYPDATITVEPSTTKTVGFTEWQVLSSGSGVGSITDFLVAGNIRITTSGLIGTNGEKQFSILSGGVGGITANTIPLGDNSGKYSPVQYKGLMDCKYCTSPLFYTLTEEMQGENYFTTNAIITRQIESKLEAQNLKIPFVLVGQDTLGVPAHIKSDLDSGRDVARYNPEDGKIYIKEFTSDQMVGNVEKLSASVLHEKVHLDIDRLQQEIITKGSSGPGQGTYCQGGAACHASETSAHAVGALSVISSASEAIKDGNYTLASSLLDTGKKWLDISKAMSKDNLALYEGIKDLSTGTTSIKISNAGYDADLDASVRAGWGRGRLYNFTVNDTFTYSVKTDGSVTVAIKTCGNCGTKIDENISIKLTPQQQEVIANITPANQAQGLQLILESVATATGPKLEIIQNMGKIVDSASAAYASSSAAMKP